MHGLSFLHDFGKERADKRDLETWAYIDRPCWRETPVPHRFGLFGLDDDTSEEGSGRSIAARLSS